MVSLFLTQIESHGYEIELTSHMPTPSILVDIPLAARTPFRNLLDNLLAPLLRSRRASYQESVIFLAALVGMPRRVMM